jgi:hypothetical protein
MHYQRHGLCLDGTNENQTHLMRHLRTLAYAERAQQSLPRMRQL